MAERPKVQIVFKQLASTLVERLGACAAVLLLSKVSSESAPHFYKVYKGASEIDYDEIDVTGVTQNTANVVDAIKLCAKNNPKTIVVSNLGFDETWKNLVRDSLTNCVITSIDDDAGESTVIDNVNDLAINKGFGCMTVYAVSDADSGISVRSISNICVNTDTIHYVVGGEVISNYMVSALYAGAIAACDVNRSLTNYTLPGIDAIDVHKTADIDNDVKQGFVCAEMMAGKPRVVAGINTAEVSGNVTEDMQHIEVVQAMNMMCRDITETFCEYYRGAYKNNYSRQLLLIAAINGYFRDLGEEEVLDPEYDNVCEIDVEHQRQAWIDKGKSEAESWSDDKVRLMSYGRKVFLKANIKICQSMEDLEMYIVLE